MTSYGYQYGTSAKKLEPEVRTPKKMSKKAGKNKKSKPIKSQKYKEKLKAQEAKVAKTNFAIIIILLLGSSLLLMYRNVKIRESYAGVKELSKTVSALEKENSQIAVNIQNNLNVGNVESIATSTLGMQKLSSKQTVYVNLEAKDYTEVSQKNITKENKKSIFKKMIDKIVEFFK